MNTRGRAMGALLGLVLAAAVFTTAPARAAAPTITGASPDHGSVGGGNTVAITGSGFTGATDVQFDTTSVRTFTVVDDNTIQAVAPAHLHATVPVRVFTPGGSASKFGAYNYVFIPAVQRLEPNSGSSLGGTSVRVFGVDFYEVQTVELVEGAPLNRRIAVTFRQLADGSLLFTTPAGLPGKVDVVVTTAYGESPPSPASVFTYKVV
jgi:hypothetical protein